MRDSHEPAEAGLDEPGIGSRLERAIRNAFPALTLHAGVVEVAKATGLSISQLNRIRGGISRRPHPATIRRLAETLGVTPEWLATGAEAEQLDAFALSFPTYEEARAVDPSTQVSHALRRLRRYPRELQVRACRAAVAAILDSVVAAGQLMPEGYQSLAYLDGMQNSTRGFGAGVPGDES